MSTKSEAFASLDLATDFSARPMVSGGYADDPRDLGKTRLRNAAKIELDRIITKEQVRTNFDPEAHAELVASLRANGLQQAIRVWWSAADERYVVYQGERRYRAAKELGWTSIDCLIRESEPSVAERLQEQLIENIIRHELTPVEEARAFKQLIAERGCTAKDIALEIGRNPSIVQRAVRLLELPADILADIDAGIIPKSLLRDVQGLPTEAAQREAIAAYKSGQRFADVTQQVKATKGGKGAAARTKKVHTSGGIKVEAVAKKKFSNTELIAVLEEWLTDLRSDGRSKKAA